MRRFNSAARRGILFVVLSWLCVSLAMLLGMAWLHTPAKTPSVNYKVWVACAGLVGSAVAWMFNSFKG